MLLTERHIISLNHPFYKECDNLCFQAKNIYNQGLYNVRQYFFNKKEFLNYESNYHVTKNQECYSYLPTKVFCQILKKVNDNFVSFFKVNEDYKINPQKYEGRPKIPKYLNKENGRFVTIYPKQAISLKEFKKSRKIHLTKTNIFINTKIKDFVLIKEARIVNKNRYFVIEIVYEEECKSIEYNGIIASIDLGLNNLATVTFNNGEEPLIINGHIIKSINQFFNKEKAKLQSKLKKEQYMSKQISKLCYKRNNKIEDYLHKSSRALVNQLVSRNVTTLVIGKNKNMKQDINLGKVNNQNFVQAPIMRFADIIKYKCELEGIIVIFQEESYTSKCSFFDQEDICEHEVYLGKRIKRGLYRTKEGNIINADVNGSYNIMKKAIPNAFANGIEGLGVNPSVITVKR